MVTKKLMIVIVQVSIAFFSVAVGSENSRIPALKDVFAVHFLIGGAFNRNLVSGKDPNAAEIAIKHFNTATSENDMKWSLIHPQPDRYVHIICKPSAYVPNHDCHARNQNKF